VEPGIGEALLYSIESHKIKIFTNKQPPDVDADTLDVIEEKIAEASEGEVRLTWNMSACDFKDEKQDYVAAIQLLSKAVLCWEVKCVTHSNQVTTLCSKTLLPDACLPIGSYVSCSATIPKPPFRTRLEIGVKIIHSKAVKTTSRTLRVNAFGLKVFAVPSDFDSAHVMYGGDLPVWSPASNSLLGQSAGLEGADRGGLSGIPEGFEVARRVQWAGQHALDIRLCFRAKLSAAYDVTGVEGGHAGSESSGTSTVDSTWKMMEGSTIRYSWCLCRCRPTNGVVVVASGEVTQSNDVGEEEEGGGGESTLSDNLLQPWLWRDQNVLVAEAATNDTFALCVKVDANPPVRNLKDKCKVQVSRCGFYVAGENYEKQKDVIFECQGNPTALYSSFNNSSVSISI
jgi:hypothetical protein